MLKRFFVRTFEKHYYDECEAPCKDAQNILKRFLVRMLEKYYYE